MTAPTDHRSVPLPTGPVDPVTRDARTPMDAYDYGLPESAIAQEPVEPRSAARLLVGPGMGGDPGTRHATMGDLPGLLRPGDLLVVNETRVLAARLALARPGGGRAEVLLVEPLVDRRNAGVDGPEGDEWEALVRPGRRLRPGTQLVEAIGSSRRAVVEVGESFVGRGTRRVRLLDPGVVYRAGSMPLPHYIHQLPSDPDRYQTVYAADRALVDRSAAAPTAGLHFTDDLLAECRAAGAQLARLDLAIGLDTFRPVTADNAEDHVIHSERYTVPPETVAACRSARRVVAVGTTAVRALESAAATGVLSGRTDLYIHGAFRFRVVDVLVTNFHLPRSSLLLMVESFSGPGWRNLYATALHAGYRFLSFGDAMIVGRAGSKGAPRWADRTPSAGPG